MKGGRYDRAEGPVPCYTFFFSVCSPPQRHNCPLPVTHIKAGGAGEKSGGATTEFNFAVHLVQPTDEPTSAARGSPSRSTPAMSPIAASSNAPSVPFLQFMSPRHADDGGVVDAPDSPMFEFQNTAFSSKAVLVGAAAGKPTAAAVGPRPNKSFVEAAQLSGGPAVMMESTTGGEAKGRTHSSSSRGGSDAAGRHGGEEKVAETAREESVTEAPRQSAAAVVAQVTCSSAVPTVGRPQKAATEEEVLPRLDVPLDSGGLDEGHLSATAASTTPSHVGGEGTRVLDSLSSNTDTPMPHAVSPSDANTGDDHDIAGNALATTSDDWNNSDVPDETPLSTPLSSASTPMSASPPQLIPLAVQTNSMYTGAPPTPTPTAGTTPSSSTSVSPLVPAAAGMEPYTQLQVEVPPANGIFSNPTGGHSRFSAQTPISSSPANETPPLPSTVGSAAAAAAMPPGYTAWQSQHAEEAVPPSSEESGRPPRLAGRAPPLFSAPLPSLSPLPEASVSASTNQAQDVAGTGIPQLHVEVPATDGASSNPSGGRSRFAAQTPILSSPAVGAFPPVTTAGAAMASPPGSTEGSSQNVEEAVPFSMEHVNLQLQRPSADSQVPQVSPPHISPLSAHLRPPSAISAGEQEGTAPSPSQEAMQDAGETAGGSNASSTSSTANATEKKSWFARVLQQSQESMSPPHISPLLPSAAATGSGQGAWGSEQQGVPVSGAAGTSTASTSSFAQQLVSSPPPPPVASTPYALPTTSEGLDAAGVSSPPAAVAGAPAGLKISVPPLDPTTVSEAAGYSTGSEAPEADVPNDDDGARGRVGMLEQTPPVSPPIPHQGSSRRFSTEPRSGSER